VVVHRRQGIEPNMTLHWFVHPRWFDEIGGFTKFENIDVYVEWAKKAFELFGGPLQPPPPLRAPPQNTSVLSRSCRALRLGLRVGLEGGRFSQN